MAGQVHYGPNFIQQQIRAADRFTLTNNVLDIPEDVPHRSVLAMTLSLSEALDKNATNCTHMREPKWYLLLQLFLSICENKAFLGGVGDRTVVPGVDLLPLRRRRANARPANSIRMASNASTSRFTYGAGEDHDSDEDEEASFVRLVQQTNQSTQHYASMLGLNMEEAVEEDAGNEGLEVDAGVRNPFAEVPDDMPTTQFFWEVVYKDEKVAQENLTSSSERAETGASMTRDQLKAQLSKWLEDVEDQELAQACLASMDRLFLSKPAIDAGAASKAGIGQAFDDTSAGREVDSITMWMFSADLYDPNWFLKAALLDDLNKSATKASSLFSTVRGQVMEIVTARREAAMGQSNELDDEDGGGGGKKKKKSLSLGRGGRGNRGRDRVARECFPGIGISQLAKLADMYTHNSFTSAYVSSRKNGSRTVNSAHPLYATTLFSPTFALLNRGLDCERAQSLVYNHENPDAAYVVGEYDERGFRHFQFPKPSDVISVDPDQMVAHHIVRKTFPHIQKSSVHPLVQRAPHAFPNNLSGGIKARHRELYQKLRERSSTRNDRDANHRREAAIMAAVHDHYRASNVPVKRNECSPFTNPTDLSALDSFVTFDEEVVANDPKLGRRPVSTIQENASRCMSVAKPLSSLLYRIEGTERRRALKLAHMAWGLERYRGTRSSQFENPDSIRALYKFIEGGGYDAAPVSLKMVDTRLGAIGNLYASMTIFNADLMHASDPQLATLLWVAMLTSATMDFKSKINVLIAGGGGTSKSFSMDVAEEERIGSNCITDHVAQASGESASEIVSTTQEVTRNTECALQTDDAFKMDLAVMIYHELKYTMLSDPNENGSGNAFWKNILEKGYSSLLAWKADDTTGLTTTEQRINMLRVALVAAINWDMSRIEDPVKQRFLIIYISDKSNEADNITEKMLQEKFFSTKSGRIRADISDQLHTRGTFTHLCHQMQAVVAELEALIGAGDILKINENIGWLIGTYVSDYMRRHGQPGFHPRTLDRFIKYARQLCMLDWFATEYLYEGGRYYGQPIRLETFLAAEPALFIAPSHMILSLGTLSPFSFKQGKKEVRETLYHRYEVRIKDFLENVGMLDSRGGDISSAIGTGLSTKQLDNLLAELCPLREYAGHAVQQQQPQHEQSPHDMRSGWPRQQESMRVGFSSSSGGLNLSASTSNLTAMDQTSGHSNLDLDYVRFRLPKYSLNEFATTIYKWMDDNDASDTKPPVKAIHDLIEHLRSVTVNAYPMRVNGRYVTSGVNGGPLVPNDRHPDGKKSFPVIKMIDSSELAIHLGFLMSDTTGENMVVDALKTLFNHVNETAKPYLYEKGPGDSHNVIWLGKGYKRGTTTEQECDLNPKTNPAAFKVFHCPSFFHHDPTRDLMYSGVESTMSADAQDMAFERNVAGAHARWTSAEMMVVDTSLERLGQCIRNQEIFLARGITTCEDIDVACDLFPKWCDGIYTVPGDLARFGPVRASASSEAGNALLQIDYDELSRRAKEQQEDAEKEEEDASWSIEACDEATLTGFPEDEDVDMEEEEAPPPTHQKKTGGKGKGKAKSRAVRVLPATSSSLDSCGSFGSIDELTQHLTGELDVDYTKVLRERLSTAGSVRVLPEDLVFDVDLPPQQFLVPNIYYRQDDPVHPLTNPRRVPIWCLLGMERWQFKDLLYTRGMSAARHAAADTHSLTDTGRRYPDFLLKDYYRVLDMKRRQRKGQEQSGVKTATVTSNIARGFVTPGDTTAVSVESMSAALRAERLERQRERKARRSQEHAKKMKEYAASSAGTVSKAKKRLRKGGDANVFSAYRKARKVDMAACHARLMAEKARAAAQAE